MWPGESYQPPMSSDTGKMELGRCSRSSRIQSNPGSVYSHSVANRSSPRKPSRTWLVSVSE